MSTTPSAPAPGRHLVTAVLVAHDGSRWLPQAAAGLGAQSWAPQRLAAVDTGSTDTSRDLLVQLFGVERVVAADAGTAFGAAVELGAAAADRRHTEPLPDGVVEWLWLLHDDVEPEPDALRNLLRFVDASPAVAIAGPKIRGWHNRRLLLEAGVTIARSGRRETGLERREEDQGQHDASRDVLAVSTAGMLVRRDVWQALGGLDPYLALFRDDVDLGWRANLAGHRVVCVPEAVVHHAEASTHGRRRPATPLRVRRTDRRNATYVLLANLPALLLPWVVLRLTGGTVLRSAGLLLGKLPRNAVDEVLSLGAVLARPDRLARARRARRRTRVLPASAALPLLATPASGLRHGLEAVTSVIGVGAAASYSAGRHRATETGPAAEEADDLPAWRSDVVRRVVRHPPVLLGLVLAAVALLASRHLLGGGRLMGGALLPAPDSAGDLWRTYTESWHAVGLGSDAPAPPYLAVLALVGSVMLGHVSGAVSLLVLAAVPLAGLSAYLALRRTVPSRWLRLWGSAAYALLPAVPAAVATGRLGTLSVAVLLPLTALATGRALVRGSARAAWTAGLLLGVMAAFAPVVYLAALLAGLAAAALRWVRGRALLRLGAVLVVPPLVLLAWLPALVDRPGLLLLDGGLARPGLVDPSLPPWAVFLLGPGGPGTYPVVITVGLLLAALAALLRPDRRGLVAAGWACALAGMAVAVVTARVLVHAPSLAEAVPGWAGPATLVSGAGLVLAAVVGAEGAGGRLAASSFGWRQVTAAAVTILAAGMPVMAAGWWVVRGADGPLERRDAVLLPAFVAAEGEQPDRPRTLVLRRAEAGGLSYALLRADGPRLGDADTAARRDISAQGSGLNRVVADLASGRGGDAAVALLPYGIRFVLVDRPVPGSLADALDAVPGLVRLSGRNQSVLWKVRYPSGRVRVLPVGGRTAASAGRVLAAGPVGVSTQVPAADGPRLVVLADRRADGWRARLDGRPLHPRTYAGWAQAFDLPRGGGQLVVRHDDPDRRSLLWGQASALLLVLVLALPSARSGVEDDEAPHVAAHVAPGRRR